MKITKKDLEKKYKLYMLVIDRQLKDAKYQASRILILEERSKLTYKEFCKELKK